MDTTLYPPMLICYTPYALVPARTLQATLDELGSALSHTTAYSKKPSSISCKPCQPCGRVCSVRCI